MARTLLALRRVDYATNVQHWLLANEIAPDVANGNYAPNDGATLIFVHNNNGSSSRTVTVTTPGTVGQGLAIADETYTFALNEFGFIGPFPQSIFGPQLLIDVSANDCKLLLFSVLPVVRE